jgi:hypothetical protein
MNEPTAASFMAAQAPADRADRHAADAHIWMDAAAVVYCEQA